jgi:hypothetical protein
VSRRDQIKMTDDEVAAFVAEEKTIIVATQGPRGWPHLMPLWFLPRDDGVWGWTYAKSQKAKNLERDPRATLGVEGGVRYEELRGVMLECDVRMEREPGRVEPFGLELFERYAPAVTPEIRAMVTKQAQKRIGLTFVPRREVSWDHRKLGGTY